MVPLKSYYRAQKIAFAKDMSVKFYEFKLIHYQELPTKLCSFFFLTPLLQSGNKNGKKKSIRKDSAVNDIKIKIIEAFNKRLVFFHLNKNQIVLCDTLQSHTVAKLFQIGLLLFKI